MGHFSARHCLLGLLNCICIWYCFMQEKGPFTANLKFEKFVGNCREMSHLNEADHQNNVSIAQR